MKRTIVTSDRLQTKVGHTGMNVLIGFIATSIHDSGVQPILSKFAQTGFEIEIVDLSDRDISLWDLPSMVSDMHQRHGDDVRISVLSDVPHLVFTWYRCYNTLVSDFVYTTPHGMVTRVPLHDDNLILLANFWTFVGIEHETLFGKVYITIDANNYTGLSRFLCENLCVKYFELIQNFDYTRAEVKHAIDKVYLLEGLSIKFSGLLSDRTEVIDLSQAETDSTMAIQDVVHEILKRKDFAPYLAVTMFDVVRQHQSGLLIFHHIFNELRKTLSPTEQRQASDIMLTLIEQSSMVFQPQMQLLFLVSKLESGDISVLQRIMDKLLAEIDISDFHHAVLYNTLAFISIKNLPVYSRYPLDKNVFFRRLSAYYSHQVNVVGSIHSIRSKTIVIFTNYLLNTQHSPTFVTLEYAKYIAKIYPTHRIVIIPDDTFTESESMPTVPWFISSTRSFVAKQYHQDYLRENKNIDVLYIESGSSMTQKVQWIADQVVSLDPDLIVSSAELSVAVEVLFSFFPVVYLSFGTVVPSGSADIYLFKDEREALEENAKCETIPLDRIRQFTGAINLPKPQSKVQRSQYNLLDTDFVMVTVGNRLDVELGNDFIDRMASFLTNYTNARWVLVGPKRPEYMEQVKDTLPADKIVVVAWHDDLPALFEICDVFVSPLRHGGGTSVVLAMDAGLPVVIASLPSDGLVYVGIENSCGPDPQGHYDEIVKLYSDDTYRRAKGAVMRERLASFSEQQLLLELTTYFAEARQLFAARSFVD